MKMNTNQIYGSSHAQVEGFDSLAELALDMRWSWNHAADEVWRKLDPALLGATITLVSSYRRSRGSNFNGVLADPAFRKLSMTSYRPSGSRPRRRRGFSRITRGLR